MKKLRRYEFRLDFPNPYQQPLWFIKTKRRRVSMLEAFSWTAALCMVWSSNRSEHPGNERESLSAKIQA
jgi:hypothetical protein